MAKEHTNNASQQPGDTPPPTGDSVGNDINSDKQKDTKASCKAKECNHKYEIPQPFVVEMKKEENGKSKRSENLTLVSIIVSLISAAIAGWSLYNTTKSVEATQTMVTLTQKRDSIYIAYTESINKPMLQIDCNNFKVFEVGKPMVVPFVIRNVGQFAARLTNGKFWLNIDSTTPDNPFNPQPATIPYTSGINTIVVKDFVENHQFTSIDTLKQGHMNSLARRINYLTFFGEVEYINQFTNDTMLYRFNLKFDDGDLSTYQLVLNDNIPK